MSVLSIDRIVEIAIEETLTAGGEVRDRVQDGGRLFLRTKLRHRESVKLNDDIEGGVALRVSDGQIWVHPYTFRLICENGAILPAVSDADHIELGLLPVDVQEDRLRDSIRDAGNEASFQTFMDQTRALLDPMAMVLMLRHLSSFDSEMVLEILERAREGEEFSAFAIFNAITSMGRDQTDPEQRWRLEKIGGGIPALLHRAQEDLEWSEELELPLSDEAELATA